MSIWIVGQFICSFYHLTSLICQAFISLFWLMFIIIIIIIIIIITTIICVIVIKWVHVCVCMVKKWWNKEN